MNEWFFSSHKVVQLHMFLITYDKVGSDQVGYDQIFFVNAYEFILLNDVSKLLQIKWIGYLMRWLFDVEGKEAEEQELSTEQYS